MEDEFDEPIDKVDFARYYEVLYKVGTRTVKSLNPIRMVEVPFFCFSIYRGMKLISCNVFGYTYDDSVTFPTQSSS